MARKISGIPEDEYRRWVQASAKDALRRSADPDYLAEVGRAVGPTQPELMDEMLDAYNEGRK